MMTAHAYPAALYWLSFCAAVIDVLPAIEKLDKGKVHEATIGKIVLTDVDGANQHAYVVPIQAKVTLNGREAKLTDLKKGDAVVIRIAMEGEVIGVAAKRSEPVLRDHKGSAARAWLATSPFDARSLVGH